MMLAILPCVPLLLWIAGVRRKGVGWRKAFLYGSIASCLFLVYSTEVLSSLHEITRGGIAVAWLTCTALAAIWLAIDRRLTQKPAVGGSTSGDDSQVDRWDRVALWMVTGIVAVVGITAIVSAPNTWDAMEYHLPRVIEWIGNRSVASYPTIDRQQLSMPPLSEYAMLHLYLLCGSDRLVNLVQWFGYAGSIAAISLCTAELGGNRKMQVFAAVLGATMPPALLAASGAKNDNLLTFWIVVTIYLLLVWKRNQSWWVTIAIGASGSLAVFSKGTAYAFLPFLFLACWMTWTGAGRRRFLLRLPVLVIFLVSVSGPLWLRNYQMTGSALGLPYFDGAGSNESRMFSNTPLGPAQAAAGILRNISIDVSVPSEKVNGASTRAFSSMMHAIGVDPNDAGQIFRGQSGRIHPFAVHFSYRNEILSANQWDFLLFVAACLLFAKHHKTMNRDAGWLALGVTGAFILFSALLRWGPWNGKYQLPLFAVAVVFIAAVLPSALPQNAIRAISFVLLALSVPLALMNYTRPWISRKGLDETLFKLPREQTYFLDDHREMANSFIDAASAPALKNCHEIGLDATMLRFEYPMMALILKQDQESRFQYLAVNNPTVQYRRTDDSEACAIVCLGCAGSAEKSQIYGANAESETFGTIVMFGNAGKPVSIKGPAESIPQAR